MAHLLEQLKSMTVTVADTGDLHEIEKYKPRDATTNPSLITTAAESADSLTIIDDALHWAADHGAKGAPQKEIIALAIDRLAVEFGMHILKIVSGRVSTEVDARLSYDTDASVKKARYLIGLYEEAGVSRERVLIKIASTWEGIRAAEILTKDGIHINMTLLFGMHQAVACAEAKVQLVSPFVGRILDWYKKSTGKESYPPAEDPGVVSVHHIYNYFKHYDYKTEVMGASFRNIGEIVELAGCDLLTIAPKFLGELSSTEGVLTRKLDAMSAKAMKIERIAVDEATFRTMHEADHMSRDKLKEGIEGFTKALEQLEKMLGERLVKIGKA